MNYPFHVKSPVVLIGFNRPDLMSRTIARVREYKPKKVYAIIDGPRQRAKEADLVSATIAEIRKLDWPCQVVEIFSEENLGSARRIISGLDLVFAKEEYAIILEDDCLPSPDFFRFCDSARMYLEKNPNIGRVGGQNRWFSQNSNFAGIPVQASGIWGWATTATVWNRFRAWQLLGNHSKKSVLWKDLVSTVGTFRKLVRLRLLSSSENRNQWGVQFSIFTRQQGLLGLSPSVDLVENVGFDYRATRTKKMGINQFHIGELPEKIFFPATPKNIPALERKSSRAEALSYLLKLIRLRW